MTSTQPKNQTVKLPGFVAGEAQALTSAHVIAAEAPSQKSKAVFCILGSSGLFMLMYALIQQLGATYPLGEVLFARGLFAIIPLAPLIDKAGGVAVFRTAHPYKHVIRSGLGLISMFATFSAISVMPLTQATSLFYTAPIITTLLAVPLLKERISWAKIIAVVVGFAGVLLMVQPQVGTISTGVAIALFAAVGQAFVAIELRSMGKTERSVTIVLYFLLASTIAGAIAMCCHSVMPNFRDALILVAIGIIGGLGQLFMTEAYRHAPASLVSPLGYSGLLWAMFFDVVLYGKGPDAATIGGVVTIASAGIFLVTQKNR